MSKLHAKDLMIGDYVQFPATNHIFKVQTISGGEQETLHYVTAKNGNGDFLSRSEWDGVPLTTKILKENGWKSYSHENTPIWGMIQGFEIVLAWMSYYWQLCVDGTIYRKIQIKHVHELQHALKLCGIEKEIEL